MSENSALPPLWLFSLNYLIYSWARESLVAGGLLTGVVAEWPAPGSCRHAAAASSHPRKCRLGPGTWEQQTGPNWMAKRDAVINVQAIPQNHNL